VVTPPKRLSVLFLFNDRVTSTGHFALSLKAGSAGVFFLGDITRRGPTATLRASRIRLGLARLCGSEAELSSFLKYTRITCNIGMMLGLGAPRIAGDLGGHLTPSTGSRVRDDSATPGQYCKCSLRIIGIDPHWKSLPHIYLFKS
jgi:hypothetical protein